MGTVGRWEDEGREGGRKGEGDEKRKEDIKRGREAEGIREGA